MHRESVESKLKNPYVRKSIWFLAILLFGAMTVRTAITKIVEAGSETRVTSAASSRERTEMVPSVPTPQPARAVAKQPVEVKIVLRGETTPSEPFDLDQYFGGWRYLFEGPSTAKVRFSDGTEIPIFADAGVKGGRITFTGPAGKTVTVRLTPPS